MRHSDDRILVTHTGSLPRPEPLLSLMVAKERGELAERAPFDEAVRDAVAGAVRRQTETGIDVVNDGEMGRVDYTVYVAERLEGFDGKSAALRNPDMDEFPEWAEILRRMSSPFGRRPACTGPVGWRDFGAVERDLATLRESADAAGAEEVFLTAASPGQIARFLENQHYASHEEYVFALAEVMRREYEAIVEAGFLLQLDCPDLALGRHQQFGDRALDDFRSIAQQHVEALNHATREIAPDRMRMHICWGSTEGPHHRDLPMEEIADLLLTARPQALAFPAANGRHEHEWRVWQGRDVGEKLLIVGAIDTTSNIIEHPRVVADRLVRFAEVVGPEHVLAGTDCGLGTFAGRVQVVDEIAWRKLDSLVEGARLASADLF
jgi:5-methyltetrahydropteroyltriglutamate--homocysteine methyltransferase